MGRAHPNLVGHWRFENNLTDTSGNGMTGTMFLGAETYVKGKTGAAFNFNAERTVQLSSESILPVQGNWSFTCWVNVPGSTPNSNGAIFTQHTDGTGMLYAYTTFGSAAGRLRWNGVSGTSEILIGPDLRGAGWKHVVLTRAANNYFLHIDGDLFSSGSNTGDVNQGQFRLSWTGQGGTDRLLFGQLDDVQIWNRALQPHHIRALYNGVDPGFLGDIA